MVRILLAFILVIFLIDTASASSKFLPKAFEANFLQEKYDATRKRTRKNNIKVKYQFSGKFYLKELSADSNTLYICNPRKVWVYNPPFLPGEKGLLREGSSSKYCFSKIFDSLSKGLKDNNLYTVNKKSNGNISINFKTKAKSQLGLTSLLMSFKGQKTSPESISIKKNKQKKGFKLSLKQFSFFNEHKDLLLQPEKKLFKSSKFKVKNLKGGIKVFTSKKSRNISKFKIKFTGKERQFKNIKNISIYFKKIKKPLQLARKNLNFILNLGEISNNIKSKFSNEKDYTLMNTKNGTLVNFSKKIKKSSGLTNLNFVFKKQVQNFKKVDKLKLYYTGEKYPLTLTVKNIKAVKGFSKNTFNFKAPKNTEFQSMK